MATYSSWKARERILETSPAFLWALNAQFGADDQTANNRDCTGQGGISIGNGNAPLTYDPYDTNTYFNGTANWISSSYSAFSGTNKKRTFAGVANHTSITGNRPLFGSSTAASGEPTLYCPHNTSNVTFYSDGDEATWFGVWDFPAYTPVHWILLLDEQTSWVDLWINGKSCGEQSHAGAYNGSATFTLGDHPLAGIDLWVGYMSYVAGWERRLSPSERVRLFNAAMQQRDTGSEIRRRVLSTSPSSYIPGNNTYGIKDQVVPTRPVYVFDSNGNADVCDDVDLGFNVALTKDPNDSSTVFHGGYIGANYYPFNDDSPSPRTFGWIQKRNSTSANDIIFGGSDVSGPRFWQAASSSTLKWTVGGTTYTTANSLDTNVHAVVFSWDHNSSNLIEIYVDGSVFDSGNTLNVQYDTPGTLMIGDAGSGVASGFDGSISHFTVWEGLLSSTNRNRFFDAMIKASAGRIIEAGG